MITSEKTLDQFWFCCYKGLKSLMVAMEIERSSSSVRTAREIDDAEVFVHRVGYKVKSTMHERNRQ